jgi:hypothetical protein
LFVAGSAPAAGPEYEAGVGRADVTPPGPIWMAGYGSRNKPSEGVETPLNLKALAIRYGQGPPFLLITADIIGWPRSVSDAVAARINADHHLPRERILFNASHTHCGPVIAGNLEGMFDLTPEQVEALRNYRKMLEDRAVTAAGAALGSMAPVRLSFGRAQAGFAANRRVFRPNGVQFGVNPEGPTDTDVPVLRIDDAKTGAVRAVVFGYACHCTTLGGDYYRIHADWAGHAQDALEKAFPGATALFVTGCGGDANPEPRGKVEFALPHGLELAGAVAKALRAPRTPVNGPITAALEDAQLPIATPPSKEEFERKLNDRDRFVRRHAQRQLTRLERDGKLPDKQPCPVQVWRFGHDLTLVALGGEVVVDYARRLRRELPGETLWVAAYANDVFAYVPTARILMEGGYEADYNLIYYGLPNRFRNDVEDVLVGKVIELVRKAGAGR